MVELKIPLRENGYARGNDVFEQILRAAYAVLIDEGIGALTMRNIAARCDLKAGHMRHYFASKQDLIRELLAAITDGYTDMIEGIVLDPAATAEQRLRNLVNILCDDIATKETTRLFTSLWAHANYDPFVAACVRDIYLPGRILLGELVREINEDLSDGEVADIVIHMQSSIEGLTVFAGHGRGEEARLPVLKDLYSRSFLTLIMRAPRPA